jgi:hypothetical protein
MRFEPYFFQIRAHFLPVFLLNPFLSPICLKNEVFEGFEPVGSFTEASPKIKNPRCTPLHHFCQRSSVSAGAFVRLRRLWFFGRARFLARDDSGPDNEQQKKNIIGHSDDGENHV